MSSLRQNFFGAKIIHDVVLCGLFMIFFIIFALERFFRKKFSIRAYIENNSLNWRHEKNYSYIFWIRFFCLLKRYETFCIELFKVK
jgi:hypothetical protein